jgi:tetratricopeptide (TPR) repeat protein
MVGKIKTINSSREMNHKNKENSNIHPILFFISLTLFLCLLSSPSWAVELDTLMLNARQTSWQGNYDESVAIYQQLINENPNDIEAMLGLATVLGWQKKYQESSTLYQKVREIHPDIPDGELGLMRLKAWQGDSFQIP